MARSSLDPEQPQLEGEQGGVADQRGELEQHVGPEAFVGSVVRGDGEGEQLGATGTLDRGVLGSRC